MKAWKEANPEKVRAQKQRFNATHRQQMNAANRRYTQAHPELVRFHNKRAQQRQSAKCCPLRVMLSRHPRIEAAARKLRPQDIHALKQRRENSVPNTVNRPPKLINSNAEKLLELAVVDIASSIVRPSWPENVVVVGSHVQTLGEHKIEPIVVNIIGIIGRRR